MWVLIWILVIGCVAGMIARVLMPGPNRPKGFVLTTALGVAGAFLATYLGHAIGLYRVGESAGLVGASIGALIILFVWNRLVVGNVIRDHGL
ncbi:MAG TPA: GlsB/YeaQ/YmgE family stress response membrane protein [Pseudolabrys sp.]|nr:GlsB/YeaQ/YmgE family stress response membrane protein [Pseudolabrys sp.]